MLTKMQSRIEPTISTGVNPAHPLARSLVGCWLLNEGAGRIVYDASGHHRHGSFSGNPVWSTWPFGHAIEFDGNDDWISMGDCLDLGTDDISVLAIVKYSATNQPDEWGGNRIGAIAGKGHLDGAGKGYGLAISTGNQIHWQIRNQANSVSAISDTALNDDRWHLVIGVCDRDDSAGVRLYVDGVLQTITADATALNGLALNGSRAFAIGSRQDEATGSWFWDFAGSIAMVCVWTRVLADAEIHGLQQNPFGMFALRRSTVMLSPPMGIVVQCTGFIQGVASTSVAVRVARDAVGTVNALASVGGTLSSADFTSLCGTVSGCSALHGTVYILAPRTVFKATLRTETPWLREALFNGATHSASKLGISLTQGWFWVRRNGCTSVYRGTGIAQVDLSRTLYVAEPEALEMLLPAYLSHPAGSTHCYLVRRFNGCGYQEKTVTAAAAFRIAPNGQLAQAQPNAIVGLRSEQVAATTLRLIWFYCPLDQKIMPARFNLYRNSVAGEIDFGNPVGNVRYEGQKLYCWHSIDLTDNQHTFAVRAMSRTGVEGMSSCGVTHRTVAPLPEPAAILIARPI